MNKASTNDDDDNDGDSTREKERNITGNIMKWFVCIALLAIGIVDAEQNAAFRERAEIYSSNVVFYLSCFFFVTICKFIGSIILLHKPHTSWAHF